MSRIVREKSNIVREKSNIVREKSNIVREKSNIVREKSNIVRPKPTITRPQNITTFTYVPTDIINQFLSNMTCLDLQELKTKNTALSKYITSDMIAKSINLNYPRSTGKAKFHKMTIDPNLPQLKFIQQVRNLKESVKNTNLRNQQMTIDKEIKLIISEFDNTFPNYKSKLNGLIRTQHPNDYNLNLLSNIAAAWLIVDLFNDYIIKAPQNIVRGDIVIIQFDGFNDNLYTIEINLIYDGRCKFIIMNDYKLPVQFRVLENNVPIDYWIITVDLSTYQYVNIDLNKHRDEILNNLIVNEDDDEFSYEWHESKSKLASNELVIETNGSIYDLIENWDVMTFIYNVRDKNFAFVEVQNY